MRLTSYSDYSLRVLTYLALNGENTVTIKEIAESYNVSKNHLMKVVNNLVQTGYVTSIRGRSGGLRLARPASEIVLGEVIRETEDDFKIVECFDPDTSTCTISKHCKLKHVVHEALFAFMNVFDRYTLEDLATPPGLLRKSLGIQIN